MKEKKPAPKWLKIVLIVVIALFVLVAAIAIFAPDPEEDDSSTEPAETSSTSDSTEPFEEPSPESPSADPLGEFHLYNHSRDIPVIDPETNQRKGTYSLIKTDSALVTDKLLIDWYENHVMEDGRGFSLLVFVDKDEKEGIYALSGMIAKNIHLTEDPSDPYLYDVDFSDAVYYTVKDGALVEQPFTITPNN